MAVWGGAEIAARHQSDRDRDPGRRGGAGRARHRDHGRLLRHGQDTTACRASRCRKAGWSSTQGRRAAHRSGAQRRRRCCCRSAATRAAGSRWCSACWPGRSTAPRSAATWSTSTTTTTSACNTGHFIIALDVARFMPLDDVQGRDRPPPARPAHVEAAARRRRDPPAGRASAARAAPTGSRTACRCRRELIAQLDKLAGELGVSRCAAVGGQARHDAGGRRGYRSAVPTVAAISRHVAAPLPTYRRHLFSSAVRTRATVSAGCARPARPAPRPARR